MIESWTGASNSAGASPTTTLTIVADEAFAAVAAAKSATLFDVAVGLACVVAPGVQLNNVAAPKNNAHKALFRLVTYVSPHAIRRTPSRIEPP